MRANSEIPQQAQRHQCERARGVMVDAPTLQGREGRHRCANRERTKPTITAVFRVLRCDRARRFASVLSYYVLEVHTMHRLRGDREQVLHVQTTIRDKRVRRDKHSKRLPVKTDAA
jgi:hypothetical protein